MRDAIVRSITTAFAGAVIATTCAISFAQAQGNSAGQGGGGGNGYAYGRGGPSTASSTSGGSAGGAPLPLLGATALGQAVGAGGLLALWLRRRNKRAKDRRGAA